jgi:integrase
VIGAIIKHAARERVFHGDNPISDVRLPTMTRRESHELTMEQAKTILKLMKYPEREVALLTICTGLGVPEICALRWRHVNLSDFPIDQAGTRIPARSIMVEKLWRYDSFRPVQPKPERYVSISDTLAAALMDVRQRHSSTDPNDPLFVAPEASQQSPLDFRLLQLKPISKELQMPWLSWQVLKRTHQVFIEELRMALTDELVSSTLSQLPSYGNADNNSELPMRYRSAIAVNRVAERSQISFRARD